jgi:hypothetical protein
MSTLEQRRWSGAFAMTDPPVVTPTNGLVRRWRLHDLLTGTARELRPHMADDFEHDGLDVEHFVGVLRETVKSAAACRAHAIATRRQMRDFFTRQMRGQ